MFESHLCDFFFVPIDIGKISDSADPLQPVLYT